MTWGKLLQPDLVLGDSILSLTVDTVQRNHLQGLVLDVDETLVPIRMAEVSPEIHQWVEQFRQSGIALWLVSNNISQTRIRRIATVLNLPYISGARKPSRRSVRQAVESMNIPVTSVGMVGDRLLTDVLVGNRLGMFTILVEPMESPFDDQKRSPIRDFEVWISQSLGASLSQQNDTNTYKSQENEK